MSRFIPDVFSTTNSADDEDIDIPLSTLDIISNQFAVYNESNTYYLYIQNNYNFDVQVSLDFDSDGYLETIFDPVSTTNCPAGEMTAIPFTATYNEFSEDEYENYVENYITITYDNELTDEDSW